MFRAAAIVSVGLLPVLVATGARPEVALRFRFSEGAGGDFDPRQLKLVGGRMPVWYCKLERHGMRLVIPPRDQVRWCAVQPRVRVEGDFQITGTYRILWLPEASAAHGAGAKIQIKDQRGWKANVGRLFVPGRGHVYSAHYAWLEGDRYVHSRELSETEAVAGKLRLVRRGKMLGYYAAEEGSDEFRKLREVEFGSEDLAQVQFAALTGGASEGVDVVWTEIEVRAGRLEESYRVQKPLWPLVVIVAVLGAVTVYLVVRLRRGSGVRSSDQRTRSRGRAGGQERRWKAANSRHEIRMSQTEQDRAAR